MKFLLLATLASVAFAAPVANEARQCPDPARYDKSKC